MLTDKCPFNLDIELWQIVCNEMHFKCQNYLMSCCKDLCGQLQIYVLQNCGKYIDDNIIKNDSRYHNFKLVNFNVKSTTNYKITDIGLQYLKNAHTINL